jgi:predicted transcriptional regulator
MATLGDLERTVMDVLWDADADLTANELRDALAGRAAEGRELAVTTVLTVLSRLENKRFVTRDRGTRPHLYRAATSRAAHMAELMHEVLGSAPDRQEVLARFVGRVPPAEADALRRMLDQATRADDPS